MGQPISKMCCVCGADVSQEKRTKDKQGRYYCQSCLTARVQPTHAVASSVPASAVSPQPKPLHECSVCHLFFGADQVYDNGQIVCQSCWGLQNAAAGTRQAAMAADPQSAAHATTAYAAPPVSRAPVSVARNTARSGSRRKKLILAVVICVPLAIGGLVWLHYSEKAHDAEAQATVQRLQKEAEYYRQQAELDGQRAAAARRYARIDELKARSVRLGRPLTAEEQKEIDELKRLQTEATYGKP